MPRSAETVTWRVHVDEAGVSGSNIVLARSAKPLLYELKRWLASASPAVIRSASPPRSHLASSGVARSVLVSSQLGLHVARKLEPGTAGWAREQALEWAAP